LIAKNISYKMQNIYCKIENIVYNRVIKTRKEKPVAKNLKLKMARVEHDMTQGDLADAIGVTLDKTLDQLFWE